LTRLQGVENFTTKTGETYKLLIPSNPPPWITESLRFFGYTEDDWIQWNSRIASVENLLVPSIRAVERTACDTDLYDYKVLSPSACQWLRSQATKRISEEKCDKYSEKIYISREDIGKRTVKNKKELNQLLDRYGFKSYSPGNLHFEEQVALFSQATDIIAPHGAGLTNLIFAENANVLEIFGTNIKKPTYYLLSNIMDHNYGFYIGTQSEEKDRDSDISVSVDELECLLSKM